jgi:peptidoglycan/xylan/chitin deacetylase (PgdA/CDA1 family)
MKYLYLSLIFLLSTSAFALNCKKYLASVKDLDGCKNKNVHLTFDDGPNTTTTPKIIETLKRQKVPATFFISTHQFEKGDLKKKSKIMQTMVDSKFTIASHGHDHDCHDIRIVGKNIQPGFTGKQRRNQIKKSIGFLNKYTNNHFKNQKHRLIRFPYGRGISPSPKEIEMMAKRDKDFFPKDKKSYGDRLSYYRKHSPAMKVASEPGFDLDHIGWNHDSKDSSSKYNNDTKDKYIEKNIKYLCQSRPRIVMSLFHDTKSINSLPSSLNDKETVMDEIIAKAKCLGVNFRSMDEILKLKPQAGVHIKSYNAEERLKKMEVKKISINNPEVISCSTVQENDLEVTGEPCVSKSNGKTYSHCEGQSSICMDGVWITNRKLYEMSCNEGFSVEATKIISTKYLKQSCAGLASQTDIIEAKEAKCICMENSENKLMWRCFDIREGKKAIQI